MKGLTVGEHKKFLEQLIEEFEEKDYSVRLPWSVLNASSYGVPLGHLKLLSMEMSHAAEFWRIAFPIQKRDRKSGARKRAQQETEHEGLSRIAM